MFEIIHKDLHGLVVVHPILLEEQCHELDYVSCIQGKSVKRKCEWLTTHKVLHEILNEPVTYTYNSLGKPELNKRSEKVSISHSKNYSAVIVHSQKKVGIDIEELSPRIFKISERFVNLPEQNFIDKYERKTELLYIIWCAKEALYKVSEVNPDFKDHIFIEEFMLSDTGIFNAQIVHPKSSQKFCLNYKITNNFVLVWVIE